MSEFFEKVKHCLPFDPRPRFRLRLQIKIPAPVKLCRTWRKFMGLFLTPESNCLPNFKRNEPYWRKLSTSAASNHRPEKRNFNASIFVSNKFTLKFHWKSVFTFLSATCDDLCWSATKDNSSFPDPDFRWIKFTFSFSLFISRLGWNTWLALIQFRFSVLVIHECMTVSRFISTCISNHKENSHQLSSNKCSHTFKYPLATRVWPGLFFFLVNAIRPHCLQTALILLINWWRNTILLTNR